MGLVRTARRAAMVFATVAGFLVAVGAPSSAADELTVSGVVSTPTGELGSGYVAVYDRWGEWLADDNFGSDGRYSLTFAPSEESTEYNFEFSGGTEVDENFNNTGFNFWRTDVEVTGNRTLDVADDSVPFTVHLVGPDGTPRTGHVQLSCQEELGALGESEDGPLHTIQRSVGGSAQGTGTLSMWALAPPVPDRACTLHVTPADGSRQFHRFGIATVEETEKTIVIPDPVTLSGEVATSEGPATTTHVRAVSKPSGVEAAEFFDDTSDGTYSLRLAPGTYDIQVRGITANDDHTHTFGNVEITEDTTLDGIAETAPVTVHLVDESGAPAEGTAELACSQSDAALQNHLFVRSSRTGTGLVTPHGLVFGVEPYQDCYIANTVGAGPNGDQPPYFEVGASGAELTLVMPSRLLMVGGPDQDGVSGETEAQAPNGGDGNADGIPDSQQANVTSLPANGSAPGGGASFVTVAAPAGVELADVTTMDPGDATTPPPNGVTLPNGLVSFALTGVPEGSDQTVSLFMGSTDGINGYAKYDAVNDTWTILPDDRVDIAAGRVDIRLTDGGVGDDDGLANGEIVDPGGIAVVPEQGDTTPPIVTGTPTTSPNTNGWYRGNVRIDWSATDDGTGVATQPADTIVSTEGSSVTAESPQVCDTAPTPNCTRGTVTGLKIDKTRPTLSIGGVSDGATYVLGAAPRPTCVASDSLSGLAAPCSGVRAGGNRNGVGRFSYTAAAVDKAGNRRWVSVSYRVIYRVDGFAAPLNNPPSATSVFRGGVTVPVALSVKRADGQVVNPVSRPAWVTPTRGARTTLAVNETAASGPGSSGSYLTWRNGRWEYAWSTKGLTKDYLYRIGVRLDDGTTRYLTVGLR